MPSVQFYTMVNDTVGYALLTGFTEQTTHELQMAFAELKQKGMRQFHPRPARKWRRSVGSGRQCGGALRASRKGSGAYARGS